ncbi:MAG: hypothetical protein HQK89_02495 [Nitrospirae bacterium]|nr:hypothetical protein [Nitrospirota bacterium]
MSDELGKIDILIHRIINENFAVLAITDIELRQLLDSSDYRKLKEKFASMINLEENIQRFRRMQLILKLIDISIAGDKKKKVRAIYIFTLKYLELIYRELDESNPIEKSIWKRLFRRNRKEDFKILKEFVSFMYYTHLATLMRIDGKLPNADDKLPDWGAIRLVREYIR